MIIEDLSAKSESSEPLSAVLVHMFERWMEEHPGEFPTLVHATQADDDGVTVESFDFTGWVGDE